MRLAAPFGSTAFGVPELLLVEKRDEAIGDRPMALVDDRKHGRRVDVPRCLRIACHGRSLRRHPGPRDRSTTAVRQPHSSRRRSRSARPSAPQAQRPRAALVVPSRGCRYRDRSENSRRAPVWNGPVRTRCDDLRSRGTVGHVDDRAIQVRAADAHRVVRAGLVRLPKHLHRRVEADVVPAHAEGEESVERPIVPPFEPFPIEPKRKSLP